VKVRVIEIKKKRKKEEATDLHESSLYFSVGRGALGEASAADRVDLVHEDDAGLVVARVREHLPDHARRLADVLVHDGARHDLEEVAVELAGDGARQQRLAGAGRPVQEDALGRH